MLRGYEKHRKEAFSDSTSFQCFHVRETTNFDQQRAHQQACDDRVVWVAPRHEGRQRERGPGQCRRSVRISQDGKTLCANANSNIRTDGSWSQRAYTLFFIVNFERTLLGVVYRARTDANGQGTGEKSRWYDHNKLT